jgi:oligopeptide/dipeptide ABC transporter ATP-binding protein
MVKVEELLTTVGLNPEDKGKYPHQFSGGQLQRVCIARAISLKPKMIVMDEAVSSLDVSVQAQILNLLADLKEQFRLSYVFISHDIEAVYYLSDSLAVMYLGRIVELIKDIRTVNEVLHPYSQKLLSSVLHPHPRYRKPIDCRVDELSLSDTATGCSYASRCEIAGDTCTVGPPPLVRVENGHFVACCMI